MSEVTFRLARLGEDQAIIDFINANFDMRLPLINRPELYHHYYAGRGGIPQFAVAEDDGKYVSAAGYILANTNRRPDVWVSVWVAVKGRNGVGLELMNALPDLLHANVLACNNIRPNTCTFYQFLGWKAERLPHYYRLGRRRVSADIVKEAMTVFVLYVSTYTIGALVGIAHGYDATQSIFESVAMASNGGISSGVCSQGMPASLELFYMLEMWAGRLEFLTLIALIVEVVVTLDPRRVVKSRLVRRS